MKNRANTIEIMDDFALEGDVLRRTLDQLGWINKYLGGNSTTLKGLRTFFASGEQENFSSLRIVDLGCGHGDVLRLIAKEPWYDPQRMSMLGLDANPDCVAYAQSLTQGQGIRFETVDVLAEDFELQPNDLVLMTLFLHHFEDEQIHGLLSKLLRQDVALILINDLQRSRLAYGLFWILSIFLRNPMARNDGLLSIKKGFLKKEIISYSKRLNQVPEVHYQWAFRYLWTINPRIR